MKLIFEDRRQAGRALAAHLRLSDLDKKNSLILALPRGGVPVAFEIAELTSIPFEVLIVRKIGHPQHTEYGIGAITEIGYYWLDPDATAVKKISSEVLAEIIEKEKKEVARRIRKYRYGLDLPSLKGKNIILVDDGLATGVTAKVAANFVRSRGAKKVTLAVPVGLSRTVAHLRGEVDEVICLNESSHFTSVSQFYKNFEQTQDAEVLDLLGLIHGETKAVKMQSGSIEKRIAQRATPLRSEKDLNSLNRAGDGLGAL